MSRNTFRISSYMNIFSISSNLFWTYAIRFIVFSFILLNVCLAWYAIKTWEDKRASEKNLSPRQKFWRTGWTRAYFVHLGAVLLLLVANYLDVFGYQARARAREYGVPIINGYERLTDKTFTPLAFTITEHRILVYDKDEKVYALDGIKLDNDLTPETLTVGTNISYTVFTKAGQLYFGRVGS